MMSASSLPRVFHIHLGDKGGAENFFVRLVQAFDAAGVCQAALTRENRVWHEEIRDHCELLTSRFSSSHIKRFMGKRRIKQQIEQFSADVVMAWMAPAGRFVPQGMADTATLMRLGDFPDKLAPLLSCKHIVGNTPEIAKRCIAMDWPKDNVHVVSNFVDPYQGQSADRKSLGVADGSFLIVGLGRFVERKGFKYLLEAVKNLPNTSLCLLGDGPLKPDFDAFVSKHNLGNRVVMPGWVSDPSSIIAAADCLCCPSLEEPLGNVVLEGWACGVPVVAADSEGPSWLINDGNNGLLCRKGDAGDLQKTLEKLIDHKKPQDLSDGGYATLRNSYSQDVIVDQYLDLMRKISPDSSNLSAV